MESSQRRRGGVVISELSVWNTLEWRVRKGEYPTSDELAAAIREAGVPVPMRDYVAGRMEGSIRRRRGRPPETRLAKSERWARAVNLHREVRLQQARLKRGDRQAPRDTAIAAVAKEHHISASWLRKFLTDGLKDAPAVVGDQLLTIAEADRIVAREVVGKPPG